MTDRQPTPEEVAAIVAAVAAAWPEPPAPAPMPAARPKAGWRFSGRWWAPQGPGRDTRRDTRAPRRPQ